MDPRGIAATVLPQSSFDPVEWSRQKHAELLKEVADRRTRYNEAWDSVEMPSDLNRNVYADLIKQRNDVIQQGAESMASGIDITDIANPKYGVEAMKYKERLNQLNLDASKTMAYDKLLKEAQKQMAVDAASGRNVINREATIANIQKIQTAKSIKEIDDFLASKGDNIVETNPEYINLPKLVADEFPKMVKPMKEETSNIEGGKTVTRGFEVIDPAQAKNAMANIYNSDPKVKASVKYQRSQDPNDMDKSLSDFDYFAKNYGPQSLRKQYLSKSEPYIPKETSDKVVPTIVPTSEINTEINTANSGQAFKVIGQNGMTYKNAKPIKMNLGIESIDPTTNKRLDTSGVNIKDAVEFTPINTAEYYTLTKPYELRYKGKKTIWPAGAIVPAKDVQSGKFKDVVKKRFVEGTVTMNYLLQGGTSPKYSTKNKSILVPYDNVKAEMDPVYGEVPQSPEIDINSLRSKYNY